MFGRDIDKKVLQALAGGELSPVKLLLGLKDRFTVGKSYSIVTS